METQFNTRIKTLLGKVKDVKTYDTKERVYIEPGKYLLELWSLTAKESPVNGKVNVIAEFKVIESSDTGETPANKAGTTPGLVMDISDRFEYGLKNVQQLLKGLSKGTAAEMTLEVLENVCGPQQPLRGKLIRDSAFKKTNPKSGKTFTHHAWTYVEQEEKDIKTRAAKIVSGAV